jgi:uncharacterized protein (TIGR02268 family)
LVQPKTLLFLALSLLVASSAVAQPHPPARQRQARRAALLATSAEPMLELYVAAGNLTTASFNASLDPHSLVVDKSRFRWAEVSDHFLMLEPFADLGADEKLIVQVGFKDRALPAKAVIAVVSKADVMDGEVEVDRRANTPEALLAALHQKDAELGELKARCEGSGPVALVFSEWLNKFAVPITLTLKVPTVATSGLEVTESIGYPGGFSALVAISLRNLPGQKPWALGQVRLISAMGAPVKVLSVQMKQQQLAPGEVGLVVVETKTPPWTVGKALTVEVVDASGQRRLSFNLTAM